MNDIFSLNLAQILLKSCSNLAQILLKPCSNLAQTSHAAGAATQPTRSPRAARAQPS